MRLVSVLTALCCDFFILLPNFPGRPSLPKGRTGLVDGSLVQTDIPQTDICGRHLGFPDV
jgi:hypothetical protein